MAIEKFLIFEVAKGVTMCWKVHKVKFKKSLINKFENFPTRKRTHLDFKEVCQSVKKGEKSCALHPQGI